MAKALGPVVVLLALLACKSDPQPSQASSAAPAAPAASSAPAAEFDAPKTKKSVGDVDFTFVRGTVLDKSAFLAFSVENRSGEEKIISSAISFQASTPSGETGQVDITLSKCDGHVPPQGKLACVLKYDFTSPPSVIRARASEGIGDGAWFKVKLEPKISKD